MIVADFLGLEISDVRVRYGDTDAIEFGTGTFGSRSVITGSNSLRISADGSVQNLSHILSGDGSGLHDLRIPPA